MFICQAVKTSEEHIKVASDLDGVIVKNLFVKEKRKKVNFLVVFPASEEKLNLKALGMRFGVGGGIRTVRDLASVIEMEQGSITPLAVLFDKNKVVETYFDQDLKNASSVVVHPDTNAASVCIQPKDLEKYCQEYGNGIHYINLDDFIGERGKETELKLKEKERQEQMQKQGGKNKQKQKGKKNQKDNPAITTQGKGKGKGKSDQEGMTKDKYTQFGDWYKEIVTKCDLIDYTDISGCYVLRPSAYSIWEKIQAYMDGEIKKWVYKTHRFRYLYQKQH